MTDEKSLPCPFCGEKQKVKELRPESYCIVCTCEAGPCVIEPTEAEAIARWNTRAEDPRDAQLREAWILLFRCASSTEDYNVEDWLRANWSHKPADISADWLKPEGKV